MCKRVEDRLVSLVKLQPTTTMLGKGEHHWALDEVGARALGCPQQCAFQHGLLAHTPAAPRHSPAPCVLEDPMAEAQPGAQGRQQQGSAPCQHRR